MQRGHRRPGASKPKDFKGTVKALFAYLRGYRIILLVATLMAALGTAMQIFGPKVMGKATTAIFEGVAAKMQGTGGIDFARIWDMLFILIALYLAGTVLSVVQGLLLANLSTDVSYRMRKDISQKIHRLPLTLRNIRWAKRCLASPTMWMPWAEICRKASRNPSAA